VPRRSSPRQVQDVVVERPVIKSFGQLLGLSRGMRKVYSQVRKAARVNIPVLLVGETGTGKELVAKEIHDRSGCAAGPFVPLNTGALSSELVASELFGHVKGSFTGATENKTGRYEEAHGGTLFLDEIATMEDRVQVALLRVLDTGKYRPIGAKNDRSATVRIIGATNENLWDAAKLGHFREDLLHRFEVIRIDLPPLREHLEDIPMLAYHFVDAFRNEFKFEIEGITEEAMALLMAYRWPGNIRELKNVMVEACVMAEAGPLTGRNLPARIMDPGAEESEAAPVEQLLQEEPSAVRGEPADPAVPGREEGQGAVPEEGIFLPLGASLEDVQKEYVLKTLVHCANNKTLAARMLGLSRKTLYDKLARWGVSI
jgi:DNA-binding NtrC family response regulator